MRPFAQTHARKSRTVQIRLLSVLMGNSSSKTQKGVLDLSDIDRTNKEISLGLLRQPLRLRHCTSDGIMARLGTTDGSVDIVEGLWKSSEKIQNPDHVPTEDIWGHVLKFLPRRVTQF